MSNNRINGRYEESLILGATGFVGSHLLQEMLYETNWQVYAQVRELEQAVKIAKKYDEHSSRLRLLKGDITIPEVVMPFTKEEREKYSREHPEDIPTNIVLDPSEVRNMLATRTLIHNCAGNVNFGDSFEKLMLVNANSVPNLLALADRCPRLKIYGHVGTAYTNPIGNGRIMEGDFFDSPSPEASGGNYAFSKTRGKDLILHAMKTKHPFAIDLYEPSIIIGHSGNGHTGEHNMTFNSYLYCIVRGIRKAVFNGDLSKLVQAIETGKPDVELRALGYETTMKSCICVDEVARRMLWLSLRRNPENSVFHIAGEPLSGLQIGRAINSIFPFLKMKYVGEKVENPSRVEALIGELTKHLDYYVTHSDDFDTTRAEATYDQVGYTPARMDLSKFTAVNARYVDKLLRELETKEKAK